MKPLYLQIIETAAVILFYILARKLSFKIIRKTLNERVLQESRGLLIRRMLNLVLLVVCTLVILIIWGVKQADLAVFVGSLLTIVGVAFVAQWSILSNITSSLILFFNHPVKIDDAIMIMEAKDYVIQGKVINIGLFFITIRTEDGAELSLPNNVFIQKSVKNISAK